MVLFLLLQYYTISFGLAEIVILIFVGIIFGYLFVAYLLNRINTRQINLTIHRVQNNFKRKSNYSDENSIQDVILLEDELKHSTD